MNLVEIHTLQPVPPANLNRDDTGSPKDTVFGGVRRSRISSQAQKRAIRQYFNMQNLLAPEERAVRTRLLAAELRRRFQDRPPQEVEAVVSAALRGLGLPTLGDLGTTDDEKKKDRTEYLLFLGSREIDGLAAVVQHYWDELKGATKPTKPEGRKKKEDLRKDVPEQLRRALEAVLDGGKAADIALFGRMLADRPEWARDAACQVAHAISTHRVDREFDFYTAVDDLNPREQVGAGMMGDVEYYTATFYRYANVNLELLATNLQGDRHLAAKAVKAFLQAFIYTLPAGKQNTFAAHSLPQFVALLVRKDGMPRNLAAAFEKPVRARDDKSLTGTSVEALLRYWKVLDEAYGRPDTEHVAIVNLSDGGVEYHQEHVKRTIDEAVETAMTGVRELLGVA